MESENSNNKHKSSLLKWIGLIVLVVLLVTAAFVGGQLFNRQVNPLDGAVGILDEHSFQSIEVTVIPAEELPTTQADEFGVFVRREDNSIFIEIRNDPKNSTSGGESPAGPVVEVVVANETAIYQEVLVGRPDDAGEIQQEVTEQTIEDIGDTSFIWVWGRKAGDRIIADVLLYSVPVMK